MVRKGLVLFAMMIVFPFTVRSQDEVGELKQQIQIQQQQISGLNDEVQQLRSRQRLGEKSTAKKFQEIESKKQQGDPDYENWFELIQFFGDLRYRHEYTDGTGNMGDSSRTWDTSNRHRIRARLGAKAKVSDEVDVILQIATGSDGISNDADQTLDDSFSQKDLWLDQAFVTYTPSWWTDGTVLAGKMSNPFYRVGSNQCIWDEDINPEGVALSYSTALTPTIRLNANAGGFWIKERWNGFDSGMFGLQSSLHHDLPGDMGLTFGASYYDFTHIQGLGDVGDAWGNTKSGGTFVHDFDILEVFTEWSTSVPVQKNKKMPLSVYGLYIQNIGIESGRTLEQRDMGYCVGLTANEAKKPGSWQASYDYRYMEENAVLGQLSDSDFIGGGTGGKGHRFQYKFQVKKNIQAAGTFYVCKYDPYGLKKTLNRFQIDLEMFFR